MMLLEMISNKTLTIIFISILVIPTVSLGYSANQNTPKRNHILQIRSINQDYGPKVDFYSQYPLRLKALLTGAKWTEVSVSSTGKLKESLMELKRYGEFDEPITHILFHGHGYSLNNAFVMEIEKEQMLFHPSAVESNALKLLRGNIAPHVKIFFGGCLLFSGSHEQIDTRAHVVAKVLGTDDFEMFASEENYNPLFNLFPILRLDSYLPERLIRLTPVLLAVNGPYLILGQLPNFFMYFLGLLSAYYSAKGRLLTWEFGGSHEGYLVFQQDRQTSIKKLAIDHYLYRLFL